jgi:hypothetical protein
MYSGLNSRGPMQPAMALAARLLHVFRNPPGAHVKGATKIQGNASTLLIWLG